MLESTPKDSQAPDNHDPGAEDHQRFPTRSVADPAVTRAFAIDAARMLADDRCEDVLCLDVRSLSQVSDFIIVATGTSDRQMRSAADDVAKLAQQIGYGLFRRSQDDRATWIVLDCVDVVVHVFEPNTRAHYDLEMLWGDAERVEWRRPSAPTPLAPKPAPPLAQTPATAPAKTKPTPANQASAKPARAQAARSKSARTKPAAPTRRKASKKK
jgi:ribosome-associated protein